jgi:hypothetical protein
MTAILFLLAISSVYERDRGGLVGGIVLYASLAILVFALVLRARKKK